MSQREWLSALRELSGSVREAEVHEFQGRLFVVRGWARGGGVAVPGAASAEALGKLVRETLKRSKTPIAVEMFFDARREAREEKEWNRFCERVVGVPPARYEPEKRIGLRDLNDGVLQVRALGRGEPSEELPPDAAARTLGEVVLRLLREVVPQWPRVRSAYAHVATRNRLVVFPQKGIYLARPVRVASLGDTDAVAESVSLALAESSRDDEGASRQPWEETLATVGLTQRQIAGKRSLSIGELTDGSTEIAVLRYERGGWAAIGPQAELRLHEADAATLGRAVVFAALEWNPWGEVTLAEAFR